MVPKRNRGGIAGGTRPGCIDHPTSSKETRMKTLTVTLIALGLTLSGGASAADEKTKGKSQQTRMSECSAQAKEKSLKGDDRKQFMSGCLKSKPQTSAS